MTEVVITPLPDAQLYALEIWSNPAATAKRFEGAAGFALPAMGRSGGSGSLLLIRYEPTVWLAEGDISAITATLNDDGAVTAIGGGLVRLRLSGANWRSLLMESGVFDAENPAFSAGCSAATLIDHVPVRLHVDSDNSCVAYVARSFSESLLDFWRRAASSLPTFG